MSLVFQQSEATAARRRFPVYLVDATDGLTPETGEAAGQPQISKNGAAFGNTSATLTAIGNGAYYVELTATELDTLGMIVVRFKSANTAEFNMHAQVVAYDPYSATDLGLSNVDAAVSSRATQADILSDATAFAGANIDAAISSRSSHTAAQAGGAAWDEARSSHTTSGTFGEASQVVRSGTAQAGGANTITLDASASATNDFYNGTLVFLISGTGALQANIVTDYNGTTKVATCRNNWITQPDATSVFVLYPGTPETDLGTVWDEDIVAAHGTADTAGLLLRALGAVISQRTNNPTLNALLGVADAAGADVPNTVTDEVWDEASADHVAAGSLGERVERLDIIASGGAGGLTDGRAQNLDNLDAAVTTRATPAQVNTEVNDVLAVDTQTLPGQTAPPASPTIVQMATWIYKALRNRKTQTASQWSLYDDAGTTVDAKATVSDDGTTAEKAEIVTGP